MLIIHINVSVGSQMFAPSVEGCLAQTEIGEGFLSLPRGDEDGRGGKRRTYSHLIG